MKCLATILYSVNLIGYQSRIGEIREDTVRIIPESFGNSGESLRKVAGNMEKQLLGLKKSEKQHWRFRPTKKLVDC